MSNYQWPSCCYVSTMSNYYVKLPAASGTHVNDVSTIICIYIYNYQLGINCISINMYINRVMYY